MKKSKIRHIFLCAMVICLNIPFTTSCCQKSVGTEFIERDYAALVDPQIGTQGKQNQYGLASGFTFAGATYPFGMLQMTPSHFAPQKGIVVNQISGGGCPTMGNFPVLGFSGRLSTSPDNMDHYQRPESFDQADAGYMSMTFQDKVKAEMTTSARSGNIRFTIPEGQKEATIIIGGGINTNTVDHAWIKVTSDSTLEGYAKGGDFCGSKTDYGIWFCAEFDTDALEKGTWKGSKLKTGKLLAEGKRTGAYFVFDTEMDNVIEYKVAISYVSLENARANLKLDNAGRNFDQVREDTHAEWNRRLGIIKIGEADSDKLVQFYTNLYHTLIHPNIFNDVNGEYMGADFKVHKTVEGHNHYTTYSGWDTYRTQCQLVAMLYPEEASDMAQSLIDFADQAGGYGRWILANIETGIMHGDPTSIIIANTYAFGARDFDQKRGFYHMKRGAIIPGVLSQNVEVRPGLRTYMEKGIENASLCLEYTSADYAIGQFAKQALGNVDEAEYFFRRSKNWKNLYDSSTNWLRSRNNDDMSWKDVDADWREATKENYFWMVPYDLPTLIDTMGGIKAAEARLDTLFNGLDASYDDHHYAAGNEPDFQVPWIYNWVGRQDKASRVISRILDDCYDSSASGLPGNDDCGAMGAWYVFASIGMYPMIPGVGGFTLNRPQFKQIQIELPDGLLNINCGQDGFYIHKMYLNGKRHKSLWLDWEAIMKGADIQYFIK